jgi:hypothetical protein
MTVEQRSTIGGGAFRRTLPHAWAVTWRLFAALGALALGYLVLANVLLLTPAVRAFGSADDMRLGYDWAFSPWPGHIIVKNLSVRFQDHNVQFLIGVERGALDVSLHELLSKRVHLLHVDADNVSYRMRHKVSRVGLEGPRLAAYPPIDGFKDPPLFEGPPSPAIPDSQYHLWDVRVEDVKASVKEVWILEYRYVGGGVARGNFHVKPARWYEVYPASLELHGGKITLGSVAVAEHANLVIDCRVEGSDPRQLEGLEPFHKIHAAVRGKLEGTDLAFLDAYLGPHAGLSARGNGSVTLDAKLERGVAGPGTSIELSSPGGSVGNERFRVQGAFEYRLHVAPGAVNAPIELGFRASRLTLAEGSNQHEPPRLEHVDSRLELTPDLTAPLEVLRVDLAPLRVELPALAWISDVSKDAPALSGNAEVELEAHRDGTGGWTGVGHARAPDVGAEAGKVKFAGSAKLDVQLVSKKKEDDLAFRRVRLELASREFAVDQRASRPWTAVVTSNDLELSTKSPGRAEGTLDFHADDASALLPLVVESPFARRIESTLLALKTLDGRVAFAVGNVTRVELLRARAGIAQARGAVSLTPKGPTGAFLVSTSVANIGIRVRPGETHVVPLVGDDWLDKPTAAHPNATP